MLNPKLLIPLRTPDGCTPNDASVGDLDGDGDAATGEVIWGLQLRDPVTHAVLGAEQSRSLRTAVSIDEVIRSKKDLWGDAAMQQEDGPGAIFPGIGGAPSISPTCGESWPSGLK